MTLKDENENLLKRMQLPENSEKYNELLNPNHKRNLEDARIYWEMKKKIPDLLDKISNEDNAENNFLIASCGAAIDHVKALLDAKGWL